MRKVAGVAVAIGLALSACTTNGEGPRTGGVAAEVGETTIALDEVESMTDAYCTALGAAGQAAPRARISQHIAVTLVQAAMLDELEMATDVSATEDPSTAVPGWAEMAEDQQAELRAYLEVQARMQTALIDLGAAESESPEQAIEIGQGLFAERVADELDVAINPRFELQLDEGQFEEADELSVGISDAATAAPDDLAHLATLPAAQVCGTLPENAQVG